MLARMGMTTRDYAIIGGGVVIASVTITMAWAMTRGDGHVRQLTPIAAVPADPAPAAAAAPPEPSPSEQVMAKKSLASVLAYIEPVLGDSTDEPNPGAAMLALWSEKRLTWEMLQTRPATTYGLVMKDPLPEHGKRICISGSVVQITTDRSAGFPIYVGQIMTNGMKFVHFNAVKSSGKIVEDSPARFCGVVTGRYSFSNTGGGTTLTVNAVGMFDLPENRHPGG